MIEREMKNVVFKRTMLKIILEVILEVILKVIISFKLFFLFNWIDNYKFTKCGRSIDSPNSDK